MLDIEGTTTPIAFVSQTLFPYARRRLRTFLDTCGALPECAAVIDRLRQDRKADPNAPGDAAIADYVEWLMDRDHKSTALKELQGLIWAEGYRTGELRGEVFSDVAPALRSWRERGIGVGIFSSGSVLAQQLLFRHSSEGDLEPLLGWHFDTTTGPKTAQESYRRIADTIGVPTNTVLFVSDAVPELDAARAAGLETVLSIRPGNAPVANAHDHPIVRSFDELRDI